MAIDIIEREMATSNSFGFLTLRADEKDRMLVEVRTMRASLMLGEIRAELAKALMPTFERIAALATVAGPEMLKGAL